MAKLPKPRFNLKSPTSKTETLIFLIYRYRGKKLVYSTGLNIIPRDWNSGEQRPYEMERRKDLWILSQELENLVSYCKTVYIESDYGNIDVEEFKDRLDILSGKKNEIVNAKTEKPKQRTKKSIGFFEFAEEEMIEMKDTFMNSDSLKSFKLHTKIIKQFAEQRGGLTFDDVDWNLRLELIDWLTKRNVQLAYGNKTLKVLRQLMERARRKKLHRNIDYQGRGWTVPETKAKGQIVTLNPVELQTLADLQLFGFAEKVRDLFLIGAGTGQRFSDFSKYVPNNFYQTMKGTPLVSVISQKTNVPAKVPLNIFPWLIPILEKYDYHSPQMPMQKLNDWIKDICKKAKFDHQILRVEQYMGRKPRIKKFYMPKYGEISSHTCRRSFATNLYRMGYSLAQIMPMTGHSTEAQLRQYIGIDGEENAETIAMGITHRSNQLATKGKAKAN